MPPRWRLRASLDWRSTGFRYYFEQYRHHDAGFMREASISPVSDVPDVSALTQHREAGRRALGRAVVVKLNGGLGTTMGMRRAKSLLPAKGELTFLDVIARQVLHLRRQHASRCRSCSWTASARARTRSRRSRAIEGLAGDLPLDFLQHKVPRIAAADLAPVAGPPTASSSGARRATATSISRSRRRACSRAARARLPLRVRLERRQPRRVLDLAILGWFARERLPFAMEVCDRSEAHKRRPPGAAAAGGLVLREIAQSPEDLDAFQDVKRHRFFNTNNLGRPRRLAAVLARARRPAAAADDPQREDRRPGRTRVAEGDPARDRDGRRDLRFPGARALRVPRRSLRAREDDQRSARALVRRLRARARLARRRPRRAGRWRPRRRSRSCVPPPWGI